MIDTYLPNKRSIKKHKVPEWFHDVKFGIFIHWGLYSIPAFAPTKKGSIIDLIKKEGWLGHFKNNPYAEWYLNSIKINDSPAQKYHFEVYGNNFSYDDFVPIFKEEVKNWDPEKMAELFKKAGAKYVILVTKHHDGFLLWPSENPNPNKKNWHSDRDIVGELTNAIKKRGLKMGFYYSGALDWSFTPKKVIKHVVDLIDNGPTSKEYTEYVNKHYYELIDKYTPSILWNDIGYPPKTNVCEIIAYFYNKISDGVINDRWAQTPGWFRKLVKIWPFKQLASYIAKKMMINGKIPTNIVHCDFITPEYTTMSSISKKKWETTRGIGNSFGYNKFETSEDYLTARELIHLLIDVVSKNGNLLLNVGPKANGEIPEIQKDRILAIGKWLEVNGDAIYGTRPWIIAESCSLEDIPIRFAQKNDTLFIFLLDSLKIKKITIPSIKVQNNTTISLLGMNEQLEWEQNGNNFIIKIPKQLNEFPAYTLVVRPKPYLIS
ncbi:MAG: alpha-L-fucosidase [Candidatus Helarchaeota archaeon]